MTEPSQPDQNSNTVNQLIPPNYQLNTINDNKKHLKSRVEQVWEVEC